jgi:hypothetical protein
MKVVILPAGPATFASARIRAYWVAKYWPEATVHTQGPLDPRKYDVFVFQKVFWESAAQDAKSLNRMGKTVAWDLCEPMWWTYPHQHALMAREVKFAVACSRHLAGLVQKELGIPCHFIPDRHDPAYHPHPKVHRETDTLRFVWFGYSGNRFTLYGVVPYLQRLRAHGKRFDLLVIDEHPEVPLNGLPCPVVQRPWNLDSFHGDMLQADAALLPVHPGPFGRCKSNNKEMTAAWCGLPVVNGEDWEQLRDVFDLQYRIEAGRKGRRLAEESFDVRASVQEWGELLQKYVQQGTDHAPV